MECMTSHTKETHSRGWERDYPGKLNVNSIEKLSEQEIRTALFDTNPDKAPGPDGMTNRLFQKFLREMRQDIIRLVRDFFATGSFDPLLNKTNICLIPKKKKPRNMTEFRPISLCNVSYKIISKLI